MANDPTHQFLVQKIVPIEIGGIDFSFTNASLFMVATVAAASSFLYFSTSNRGLIPTRMQSVAEMAYEFIASMLREGAGSQGVKTQRHPRGRGNGRHGQWAFREGVQALGLSYAVSVISSTSVWAPGSAPLPPAPYTGRGRVPTRARRAPGHQPLSVKDVALGLELAVWHTVAWREGTNQTLRSRFARVRVRAAHRHNRRAGADDEQWLLIEWPKGQAEPTRYWLSTLPLSINLKDLVNTAKMRWRIEHDYHELKQEFGLSHYEGRGWTGFHHHAALCVAAYRSGRGLDKAVLASLIGCEWIRQAQNQVVDLV